MSFSIYFFGFRGERNVLFFTSTFFFFIGFLGLSVSFLGFFALFVVAADLDFVPVLVFVSLLLVFVPVVSLVLAAGSITARVTEKARVLFVETAAGRAYRRKGAVVAWADTLRRKRREDARERNMVVGIERVGKKKRMGGLHLVAKTQTLTPILLFLSRASRIVASRSQSHTFVTNGLAQLAAHPAESRSVCITHISLILKTLSDAKNTMYIKVTTEPPPRLKARQI